MFSWPPCSTLSHCMRDLSHNFIPATRFSGDLDSWLIYYEWFVIAKYITMKTFFCRHLEANKTTKHSISLATHPLPEVMSLNIRKSCKHQHWKDFYCLCLSYSCTFSSESQMFFKLISTGSNALVWNRGRQRRGHDYLRLRNHSPAGTRHPCLLISHLSTEVLLWHEKTKSIKEIPNPSEEQKT